MRDRGALCLRAYRKNGARRHGRARVGRVRRGARAQRQLGDLSGRVLGDGVFDLRTDGDCSRDSFDTIGGGARLAAAGATTSSLAEWEMQRKLTRRTLVGICN